MIISHKLKLIFIHIPKNAGTFIWNLLKKIDENIVIHWNTKYSSYGIETLHNKSTDIKELCNFDYSEYIIFCVIRNPIERIISNYNYIKGNIAYQTHNIVKNQTFKEFIAYNFSKKDLFETNYISQYDFIYNKENNLLVNKIIRYERLFEELKEMLTSIESFNMSKIELEKELNIYINKSEKFITGIDKELLELILKYIPEIEKEMNIFNYNIEQYISHQIK
jgi:hypothetical protein